MFVAVAAVAAGCAGCGQDHAFRRSSCEGEARPYLRAYRPGVTATNAFQHYDDIFVLDPQR